MDTFEEFKNLISSINFEPSYVILVLTIVVVFIFEFILIKKGILNFNTNKRKMEKAIKLNHTVNGRRISYYDDDTSGYETNSWYNAKYECIVNGKKEYIDI